MARQSGRDVALNVKVDRKGLASNIAELDGQLGKAFGGLASGLKVPFVLAGIGEIPAATTALAQLAGALQQVAQAGLVIPGVIAGAAASISTLSVGVFGVKDAYDAVTKAADAAGTDQTRSANQAASAQREVNNAYRDARQELEDLNLQLRGGQLSQEEAILNAQKARRQLGRDIASGSIKDQLDLQSSLLSIRQADQRVAEVTQGNIELQRKADEQNAKGVEGNDRVVAAHEAVANAASSAGAANSAAAIAMGKLSPNAREFVQTITELKPAFTDLQQTVQDNLFAGLSQQLKTLAAADLPHVRDGMGRVATSFNGLISTLATSLGSEKSRSFIDRIFGNTADAQTRLQAAVAPLVNAIGTLATAGSNALPRLVDDFVRLSEKFNAFITAADQDGSLDRWINEGITAVEHLGATLLNIGEIFTAITKAAGGGDGLLGLLDRGSARLAEFLNSVEGQNKLKEWFEEGRRELQDHIIPLLKAAPGFIKGVVDAGKEIADVVVPPLRDISHFLGEHPHLIQDVVIAFAAFKGIAGVASLISDLSTIEGKLGAKGTGKKGLGGKGILGALGLLGAGVALDGLSGDGDDKPEPPRNAAPAPGALDPGELPAGTPVPFGTVPVVTPDVAAPIAKGAGAGGLAGSPFGPLGTAIGTGVGALSSIPDLPPDKRNEAEKTIDQLIYALPQLSDDIISQSGLTTGLGLTVDQVKKMSRNELRQRWLTAMAALEAGKQPISSPVAPPIPLLAPYGGPPPPTQGPPALLPPGIGSGYAAGGVLPGYSPGRDNMLVPLAGGEGIIRPEVVAKLGPEFIHGLNRGYATGGIVDEFGNPATPGPLPGPDPADPIAPNPAGGGLGSIGTSFLSGLGGVSGNLSGLIGRLAGASNAGSSGNKLSPGLAGLSQAGDNPLLKTAWAQGTGEWLGTFGAKALTSFGSTLWQGALGFFGLQNSILSPSNAYFQAGSKTAGFFLGKDGPFGGNTGGDTDQAGMQTITLGDGSTIQIPTYGTSATPAGRTAGGATASAADASPPGAGAARWTPIVREALQKVGAKYGITNINAWTTALVKQIDTESHGDPNVDNLNDSDGKGGKQAVYGLGQFLPSTFAAHNITGGDIHDGTANVYAMIDYVARKYGQDSTGAPKFIGEGHGYATGGVLPGYSPGRDNMLVPLAGGEGIIRPEVVAKLGPEFIHGLNRGYALGGIYPFPQAAIPAPPPPPALPEAARAVAQPPPPLPRPAPANPAPPPAPTPPAPAPPTLAPEQPPPPQPPETPAAGPAPTAAPPTSGDHVLPALSKGITSAASTLGSIASTAISAAAAAGTFGAAGALGGGGGSLAAGLFQQAGKIGVDVANVPSSFLVGNVTPGTTDNAYGELLSPPQNVPDTAPLAGGPTMHNTFYGHSTTDVIDALELKQRQDFQAQLARVRG